MKTTLKILTALTLAGPAQAYEWTDWVDMDDPSGTRDRESISALINQLDLECDTVAAVQARRISDGILAQHTGEVVNVSTNWGFTCVNADQPDGACDDYEMRIACVQWTGWLDRADGGAARNDNEFFHLHVGAGDIMCDAFVDMEARRVSDKVDATETGENLVIDERGLRCRANEQDDNRCDDYEVRYLCADQAETVAAIETYRADDTGLDYRLPFGEYSGDALAGIRLAQITSQNGTIGSTARMDESGRVKIDYNELDSSSHPFEHVRILALMGDLNDLGVQAHTDTIEIDEAGVQFMIQGYYRPVVFAQVVSNNEADPVVANVALSKAPIRAERDEFYVHLKLDEAPGYDGVHGLETVNYVVVEQGVYQIGAHGEKLIVGNWGTSSDPEEANMEAGFTGRLGPELLAQFDEVDASAVVITRPQGGTGWRASRAIVEARDNRVQGIDIQLEPGSNNVNGIGYMIFADDYQRAEFDESVLDECSGGQTSTTNTYLFTESDSYGNGTIGASHNLTAGVERTGVTTWAGALANLTAKLFGVEHTLLGFELSSSVDQGDADSRMYFELMGQVYIDDPIGLNTEWSTSATFFSASATFYSVVVSGELVGTVGIEAGASIAGAGVAVEGTPFLDITASASAGVGGWCLSAGVGADLSIAAIEVPTEATLGIVGGDIAWSIESKVEMSTLDGEIYLYVDYCIGSDDYKIFGWNGIDLPTIELIDEGGCL